MKILYITGLSRSGTTYLSNLIVSEFNAVSIGEIIKNIEIYQDRREKERYKKENRRCTCGEYPENCLFWGEILQGIDEITADEAFDRALQKANKIYPNALILDTSKSISRLSKFYSQKNIEKHGIQLVSVNIIRHCFGQIESYQKYHKAWNRKGFKSSIIYDAIYWLGRNYKNLRFFNKGTIPCKTIFYEDLIFHKSETVGAIKKFISNEIGVYNSGVSVIHEMSGNEGFKKNGRGEVRYQSQWMFNWRYSLLSWLMFPFLLINSKWYKKYTDVR